MTVRCWFLFGNCGYPQELQFTTRRTRTGVISDSLSYMHEYQEIQLLPIYNEQKLNTKVNPF